MELVGLDMPRIVPRRAVDAGRDPLIAPRNRARFRFAAPEVAINPHQTSHNALVIHGATLSVFTASGYEPRAHRFQNRAPRWTPQNPSGIVARGERGKRGRIHPARPFGRCVDPANCSTDSTILCGCSSRGALPGVRQLLPEVFVSTRIKVARRARAIPGSFQCVDRVPQTPATTDAASPSLIADAHPVFDAMLS